jgi:hypothetical protein
MHAASYGAPPFAGGGPGVSNNNTATFDNGPSESGQTQSNKELAALAVMQAYLGNFLSGRGQAQPQGQAEAQAQRPSQGPALSSLAATDFPYSGNSASARSQLPATDFPYSGNSASARSQLPVTPAGGTADVGGNSNHSNAAAGNSGAFDAAEWNSDQARNIFAIQQLLHNQQILQQKLQEEQHSLQHRHDMQRTQQQQQQQQQQQFHQQSMGQQHQPTPPQQQLYHAGQVQQHQQHDFNSGGGASPHVRPPRPFTDQSSGGGNGNGNKYGAHQAEVLAAQAAAAKAVAAAAAAEKAAIEAMVSNQHDFASHPCPSSSVFSQPSWEPHLNSDYHAMGYGQGHAQGHGHGHGSSSAAALLSQKGDSGAGGVPQHLLQHLPPALQQQLRQQGSGAPAASWQLQALQQQQELLARLITQQHQQHERQQHERQQQGYEQLSRAAEQDARGGPSAGVGSGPPSGRLPTDMGTLAEILAQAGHLPNHAAVAPILQQLMPAISQAAAAVNTVQAIQAAQAAPLTVFTNEHNSSSEQSQSATAAQNAGGDGASGGNGSGSGSGPDSGSGSRSISGAGDSGLDSGGNGSGPMPMTSLRLSGGRVKSRPEVGMPPSKRKKTQSASD